MESLAVLMSSKSSSKLIPEDSGKTSTLKTAIQVEVVIQWR